MSDKVSGNKLKKGAILEELEGKVSKSKAIIFTNYQGLTHKQIEELKKAVKPLKADFVVAKNTLLALALPDFINSKDTSALQGPTGTMFVYEDLIGPLKQLAKTIKLLGLPSIKFGILDKEKLTSEQILKLATLPSREVLLAQLVGGLKSPIYALHRSLNWNLQKLVMTMGEISKHKALNTK